MHWTVFVTDEIIYHPLIAGNESYIPPVILAVLESLIDVRGGGGLPILSGLSGNIGFGPKKVLAGLPQCLARIPG